MVKLSTIRILQIVVLFVIGLMLMNNLQSYWNTLELPQFNNMSFKLPDLPKGEPYKIPFNLGSTGVNADHQYNKQANKELSQSLGFTLEEDLRFAGATPSSPDVTGLKRYFGSQNIPKRMYSTTNALKDYNTDSPKAVLSSQKIEGFCNGKGNKNIPGYTFSFGSSLEAPLLTPEELGANSDFTIHQNKMQANAMNNMNQNATEKQGNFLSNAMFYTNSTNTSGINKKYPKGGKSRYVIGNGVEVYDDRLKFDPESLVTNQMRHINENYNFSKNYDVVSTNGINEFNERVTFVPPVKSKRLFQEQLRRLGESDITLEDALEIQRNGGNPSENSPIKPNPSNAHPQMFDNAEFVSDTKTPFSRSIGIHPVKRHAYQPKKNTLSDEGHFTLNKYNPDMDYDRNYKHNDMSKGYAPSELEPRDNYTIDFNKHIPSNSKTNLTGNMNKLMYDTNFKHFKKGFKPYDQHSNSKYMNTGSEYASAYGSCY